MRRGGSAETTLELGNVWTEVLEGDRNQIVGYSSQDGDGVFAGGENASLNTTDPPTKIYLSQAVTPNSKERFDAWEQTQMEHRNITLAGTF